MSVGDRQRTILVAVDSSEASETACQWAVDKLVRPGDEVHLTHVTQKPYSGFGQIFRINTPIIYPPGDQKDPDIQESINAAKDFMRERFEPLLKNTKHKMEVVHYNNDANAVGQVLCCRAKHLAASAVVMASNSKGATERIFLGSTTSYCAKRCPTTLVIVH